MIQNTTPELVQSKTLTDGQTNFIHVRLDGPSAIHIAWDASVDFNATQKVYSCARPMDPDSDIPADGAAVSTKGEFWSEEPITFTQAAGSKGCKVLHLGNWRARDFLLEITPSVAGVVDVFKGMVGDNVQ